MNLVPYNPRWPAEFERERERLGAALGSTALRIEHNGSTAVPGLAAKPVIDIQISVPCLQPIDRYAPALDRLGYAHVPHQDDAFAPFFHRPAAWPHTHHVHVVQAGGDEERKALAFRDYLRANSDAAREYAALKERLAIEFSGEDVASREGYASAKTAFVERILAAARAAG